MSGLDGVVALESNGEAALRTERGRVPPPPRPTLTAAAERALGDLLESAGLRLRKVRP